MVPSQWRHMNKISWITRLFVQQLVQPNNNEIIKAYITFIPHFKNGWKYLSMLGLKLIHVSKRGPWSMKIGCLFRFQYQTSISLSKYMNNIWFYLRNLRCNIHDTCLVTSEVILFFFRSDRVDSLCQRGGCSHSDKYIFGFLSQKVGYIRFSIALIYLHILY